MINAGIIFVWSGTNASIPAGWVRETSLDGYFPKGVPYGSNPGGTGGSATHTHTGTTHLHTQNAHIHTIAFAQCSASSANDSSDDSANNVKAHYHATINSGAQSGGNLSSVACTYASVSNDPPYRKVIFIKPSSDEAGIPVDAICFVDGSSTLGFTACDGTSSTPDLRNKFLKGAAAGADSDVSSSLGSSTNVHTLTHTHTVSAHTHASATSGTQLGGALRRNNTGSTTADKNHTHTVTLESTTVTLAGESVSLTTTETVEPDYCSLLAVQNKTAGELETVGMIGMWLGTILSIPSGWSEVPNMRTKHLRCAYGATSIYSTGGANSHTHANQNHTHVASAHTHGPASVAHTGAHRATSGDSTVVVPADTHALTVQSVTSVFGNSATSAASSSNEPVYKYVAFIKLTNIVAGGSFIFNMV